MHPSTSSTYPAGRSLPQSCADPRSFSAAGDIAVNGPGFAEFLRPSLPPRVADFDTGSNSHPRAEVDRVPRPERELRAELVNDGPPAPDRKRPAPAVASHRPEEVTDEELSAPPAAEAAEPAEAPDSNPPAPSDPGDTSDTATTSSEETIDPSSSMLLAVADAPLPITTQRLEAVMMDGRACGAPAGVSAGVASTIKVADGGVDVASATAVPTAAEAATPLAGQATTPPMARVSLHAEPASSAPLAAPAAEIVQPDTVVPATVASDAATSAQPEKIAAGVAGESTGRQQNGGSVAPQAPEPSVDSETAANDALAMPGKDADVGYGDGGDTADNSDERLPGSGLGQAAATAGHAAATGRFEIPRNDAQALHSPTAQLAAPVAHAAKTGVQRVEIALEPAALGRVDVRLDFTPDGRVSAFFVAENRQALDALRADAQTLARALSDAGVDTGGLGFGLRHREQGSDGGGSAPTFGRSGGEPGGDLSTGPDVVGNPKSLFRSGSPGRLDIRA